MTAPKSKAREFWIEDNKLFPKRAYHVPYGDERNSFLNKHKNWVWVVDKSAYDLLMQQALAMREALAKTKGAMTYAYEDHPDRYYLNVRDDIEKALEQFDEFMKDQK